jgi:hypothetical protein
MSITAIIKHLDDYLTLSGIQSIEPVEANELLAKAGLLRDSKDRRGYEVQMLNLTQMFLRSTSARLYQNAVNSSFSFTVVAIKLSTDFLSRLMSW